MRRLLQLLVALSILAPSVASADDQPTTLYLKADRLNPETILITVKLAQSKQNLSPVLLDAYLAFDPESVAFVGAESAVERKSVVAGLLRKGNARLALTGLDLSPLPEGDLIKARFRILKKAGPSNFSLVRDRTAVAPKRAQNNLKIGEPISVRLGR